MDEAGLSPLTTRRRVLVQHNALVMCTCIMSVYPTSIGDYPVSNLLSPTRTTAPYVPTITSVVVFANALDDTNPCRPSLEGYKQCHSCTISNTYCPPSWYIVIINYSLTLTYRHDAGQLTFIPPENAGRLRKAKKKSRATINEQASERARGGSYSDSSSRVSVVSFHSGTRARPTLVHSTSEVGTGSTLRSNSNNTLRRVPLTEGTPVDLLKGTY